MIGRTRIRLTPNAARVAFQWTKTVARPTNAAGVSLHRSFSSSSSSSSSISSSSDNTKPFDKILIANRGEIACRIIKTCKRLGVKTVAIYSDADTYSMHVRQADEAHYVGTNLSKDSYLRMDRILEIAKKTGAQAIHPGYGFLSENGAFVDMVEAAGIAFIGPSSAPMHAMGDKINSKKIAKEANCFVIPGYEGEVHTEDDAVRLANEVGYPVMIKASAGGGGKGMRVAENDKETRDGFRLSKAEAMASFGDDRMLIERFIENPHHIEIQVLADSHGNVVAFPERECSVQRRNQKVVEESPSCLLTPETRKAMQEQAIALCLATNYRSAGTVEMLCDEQQNFYFLEMNTRLQVEHPITELVSGEDLVEHMLWIASGKPLPKRLTDVRCLPYHGWAVESRVYAEDPLRNFLPSIGPLLSYQEPRTFQEKQGLHGEQDCYDTVRCDTGVFEGGTISQYYDPMICKLCTHSLVPGGTDKDSRARAIALMETALDQYVVQGVGNNMTFLRSVMGNPKFRSGDYSTKFIEEEYSGGFTGVNLSYPDTLQLVSVAAAINQARGEHRLNSPNLSNSYFMEKLRSGPSVISPSAEEGDESLDPTAMFGLKRQEGEEECVVVMFDKETGREDPKLTFHVSSKIGDVLKVTITPWNKESNSKATSGSFEVAMGDLFWHNERKVAEVVFAASEDSDSEEEKVYVQYLGNPSLNDSSGGEMVGRDGYRLRFKGNEQRVVVRSVLEHELSRHMLPPPPKADLSKFLLSPMPGTLISIEVKEGERVEEGQALAVLEAMKMQNVLRAPKTCTVKKLFRGQKDVGSSVKVDEQIMEFEE